MSKIKPSVPISVERLASLGIDPKHTISDCNPEELRLRLAKVAGLHHHYLERMLGKGPRMGIPEFGEAMSTLFGEGGSVQIIDGWVEMPGDDEDWEDDL